MGYGLMENFENLGAVSCILSIQGLKQVLLDPNHCPIFGKVPIFLMFDLFALSNNVDL